MKIFDIIEDFTKEAVETVVRTPEIPLRIARGAIKGVENGIEELGSFCFDDEDD